MPKKNFKLTIQYLGTAYNGWQYQPNQQTIQGELESALKKILHKNKQRINLIGSGRTDSGVHAIGQIANIILDTNLEPVDLRNAMNANISNDIFIKECSQVDLDFHARFSAIKRSYIYKISNSYCPFINNREWFNNSVLDLDLLNDTSDLIVGAHNFSLLSKFNQEITNRTCNVYKSYWVFKNDKLTYNIQSNRFLHHMVRYIVGAMIEVGKGNLPLSKFSDLLNNKNKTPLIFKAPSDGLYLRKVDYE